MCFFLSLRASCLHKHCPRNRFGFSQKIYTQQWNEPVRCNREYEIDGEGCYSETEENVWGAVAEAAGGEEEEEDEEEEEQGGEEQPGVEVEQVTLQGTAILRGSKKSMRV